MLKVQTTLVKKHLCPGCGEALLKDEIPLGTVYTVYPESINKEGCLLCGRCGHFENEVIIITVENGLGPGAAPLPLDSFNLDPIKKALEGA